MVVTGYHLCAPCAQRDWERDPVIATEIARNLTAHPEAKARCGDCRTLIRVPRFRFCKGCAERSRLCQHCCRTTLTEEEQRKQDCMTRWRESYLQVVRKHGISSDEAKGHLTGCEDDEVRETLARMNIRELDWPRPLSGRR